MTNIKQGFLSNELCPNMRAVPTRCACNSIPNVPLVHVPAPQGVPA